MFLDSWAGRTHVRVRILKETPKYYQVLLLQDCIKGSAGTELKRVPKQAVHLLEGQP